MWFASALLALLAEAGLFIPPAGAREPGYRVDIDAGPLAASLAQISQLTGLSIGFAGDLPQVSTRRLSGTMSPETALRRLLQGTGLRAVRVGANLYRIETAPGFFSRARDRPTPAGGEPSAAEIVVTAQKRPESLVTVPISLSVIRMDAAAAGPRAPTSQDVSLATEGLAMTNLGPGRNRQFIRGVADSPFNGQSQSTVAVQVDDARVTFNAPDPDLRLIDIDRVEVLKGPQEPLYGSGALGGIYHVVTRRPDLDDASAWLRVSAQGVEHGGIGTGAEGVVNLPLDEGRLAVRGVGYHFLDAGWINNSNLKNSNSAETMGLRLDMRWLPLENWTVDAGFILQDTNSRDSQYVIAGANTLNRINSVREPTDNDFKLLHGTIAGDLGWARFLSATSYVDHGFGYTLDASAAAANFGLSGAARFQDDRLYTLFNQEFRLSSTGPAHWLVGMAYLRATSHERATVTGEGGAPLTVESIDRQVSEYSAFGEGRLRLFSRLDATVGARLSHSEAKDEAADLADRQDIGRGKTIISPSFSLSTRLGGQGIIYLRYARAMRPGGLAPNGQTASGHFDADELGTLDLGARWFSRDGKISASTSAYYTIWREIQSDYLLDNGLVSTRNAGRGRIVGLEGAVDWNPGGGFDISAGGNVQSAQLTHASDGLKLDDRRLPIAPNINGRLAVTKTVELGEWRGHVTGQANYIGSARLTFDDDLDREMGKYAVLVGYAEMSRKAWTIGGRIDNLLDVKGDSFAFGNPFSIRSGAQYTPLRPRTLTLSVSRRW
jgi:outer membrane receptor protein involved in Fe transport